MTRDKDEQRQFMEAMQRFSENADKLLTMNSGNTTSSIHINGGGIGAIICAVCCAIMITALGFGSLGVYAVMGDLKQDVRSLKDGEKAIRAYINTGLLKPKAEEDGTKR